MHRARAVQRAGPHLLSGVGHVDAPGPLLGIGLGEEPLQGHGDEGRVSGVGEPIGEGELRGLHHGVDGIGAVVAHTGQVEALDEVQDLEDEVGLGGGCVGVAGVAPVGDRGRVLVHLGGVGGQVLGGEEPARRLGGLHQLLAQLPPIEHPDPLLGDAPQRAA